MSDQFLILFVLFIFLIDIRKIAPENPPIVIIIDAITLVVYQKWKKVSEHENYVCKTEERFALSTALAYLDQRKSKIREAEKKKEADDYNALLKRRPKPKMDEENNFLDKVLDFLSILGLFLGSVIVIAVLVVAISLAIKLTISFLIENFIEVAITICVIALVSLAMIFLELPYLKSNYKFAYVLGSSKSFKYAEIKSLSDIQAQQNLIVNMMSSNGDIVKASSEAKPLSDPDLLDKNITEVPVPPGIAEYVLQTNESALAEIGTDLKRLRAFHFWITTVSFIFFICSTAASIYIALTSDNSAWQSLFGELGFSTVLGTFCYSSQRRMRTSQIALALFESYVAELRVSLLEIEKIANYDNRNEKRNLAWQRFRVGLNDLWLKEKERGDVLKKENMDNLDLEPGSD